MIIYAMLTGTSVAQMFVPASCPPADRPVADHHHPHHIAPGRLRRFAARERGRMGAQRLRALRQASLSLLMPVIILGGIYGGLFTATGPRS